MRKEDNVPIIRFGDKASHWKGGQYKWNLRNVIFLYTQKYLGTKKRPYIAKHHDVWEKSNNACILKWGTVIFKDNNKANFDINNLQAMTQSQFKVLRQTLDMSNRICHYCGSRVTLIRKKTNRPIWFHHPDDKEKFLCRQCYRKSFGDQRPSSSSSSKNNSVLRKKATSEYAIEGY